MGWVQAGVGIEELAGVMEKPFRPLWISQKSRIWLNQVPPVQDLEYTPLVLVSASLPDGRQRRSAGTSS
jgi:tRNA A64-2'-O-ribosylphosphate transferase